ncbi:MAG: FecR domain-containing protein [Desulfovibrio sp.]|uniref:FecR family protein n=1 Tax=Desulfovibrio sp. TaxID=885 RepID=UPI00135DFA2D|nr:FecR family protein [Desulfovibrio sp.]MTJ92504.1 FecR domain-containing protein [Desulfovibrio sp.]
MIRYALGRGAMALCLILLVASACAARDVGQVISFKAGVTAQRGGQPVDLEMKSPVGDRDVLTTDATGRAQILFDDDTTVALGSNTSLSLETVVAEGSNPAFKARMGQGVARFITGKIVEKNPDGFSVVTPDATVGIRGTIFAVRVGNGTTTVFVTNTTKQVFVNGVLVPSGFKITLPQGTISPLTPADHNFISGSVVANNPTPGGGVALAPPPNVNGGGVITPTTLAQAPLNSQGLGEGLRQLTNAYVSGSLFNSDFSADGSFSFNVNLGSGAVSNGVMTTNVSAYPATLSGGSGSISGSSLNVNNFSGGGYTGSMAGTASNTGSGLSVSGSFAIKDVSLSDVKTGTFSGSSK